MTALFGYDPALCTDCGHSRAEHPVSLEGDDIVDPCVTCDCAVFGYLGCTPVHDAPNMSGDPAADAPLRS